MRFTISGNQPGPVNGKHNIQLHQIDIMNHLIIGALEKGGIDCHNRKHPLAGQSGSKSYCVFFCHANIKETLWNAVIEEIQTRTVFHGRGNRTKFGNFCPQFRETHTKASRERVLWGDFWVGQMVQIKSRYAVEFSRIFLGLFQTFSFLGDYMEKDRSILLVQVREKADEFHYVVTVYRPDVLKAHLLKHRRVVNSTADKLFAFLQNFNKVITDSGNFFKSRLHLGFCMIVLGVGAQLGQIVGHLSHVFGDGHLVVVEDNDEIVQRTYIIHALVDHAAGKGTITDNCHDFSRLFLELFGPCHANGSGERRTAVTGDEGVTVTFLRGGKTRNAVLFAQLCKSRAPSRQELVRVTLVTDIEQNFILRKVQHTVQCNSQFHNTEIGRKVPASGGNALYKKIANILTQKRQLLRHKLFYIACPMDFVQVCVFHVTFLFYTLIRPALKSQSPHRILHRLEPEWECVPPFL